MIAFNNEKRTLTQHGLLNAFWWMIARNGGKFAISARDVTRGIPKDAVLKVDYHSAGDMYVISVARMKPDTKIVTNPSSF